MITLSRATLSAALAHVARVVERRNTIPILSNVRMAVEGGRMELTATDLDIESRAIIADIETSANISTTLPAGTLSDIVRKLPDGASITLEVGESSTVLKSGRSRFTLQTLPATDFPDIAAGQWSHRFSIAGNTLAHIFQSVGFAISTEETRYYLNGIYMHASDGDLVFVATDGHRLARYRLPLPEGASDLPGVIIPRKTVSEILRMATDAAKAKADVSFGVNDKKIHVASGDTSLVSKLIDGTFPDYTRVIPKNNASIATIDNAAFSAAVDRVSTISSDKGRAVKFAFEDGKVTLSVRHPDAGEAVDEVPVDFEASSIEIGFNARYLVDILGAMETPTIEIRLDTPGGPALIQKTAQDALTCVLMPMRV